MTENERYVVKGSDDFFLHIEDTTLTEDKHEGAIYNIYQVVRLLNEQDKQIKKLESENKMLKTKISRNIALNGNMQTTEKQNCGYCKHLQIDGMFGMWCDIYDSDWVHMDAEHCSRFKR